MTEPQTAAGRALLSNEWIYDPYGPNHTEMRDSILDIEAQSRAPLEARIAKLERRLADCAATFRDPTGECYWCYAKGGDEHADDCRVQDFLARKQAALAETPE